MKIIKNSKLKQLKACRRACKTIFALMNSIEDEHGNVKPYRWDNVHEEIFKALEEAGFRRAKYFIGVADWKYDFPWELDR